MNPCKMQQKNTFPESWPPFAIIACLMFISCLTGGLYSESVHPGHAEEFILLFSLSWCGCLFMLLFCPSGLSPSDCRILIMSCAILFRVAILPHELSDDISSRVWEELYGSPLAAKISVIFFDLGTLYFLMLLLKHRGLHPRWAILYAFNPVILYSFAGQGHMDAIRNFFLIGAICLYDRKHWGWMFIFAGLAVRTGYIFALTLPFFIRRDNWKYSILILMSEPIRSLLFPDIISRTVFMPGEYGFSSSVHGLLKFILGDAVLSAAACIALMTGLVLFGYRYFHPRYNPRFRDDPVSGCFFVIGVVLLGTPIFRFQYITWIIPFLVLRPTGSWFLLCMPIGGYLLTKDSAYLPAWSEVMTWLPFGTLLLRDIYLAWQREHSPVEDRPPESVSVIIPVKNEADQIRACIDAVRSDTAVSEIIVVDGGSWDSTVMLAEESGAKIIRHDASPENGGGRGCQIYAGIAAATGDIVAVVHADTILPAPGFKQIVDVLSRQPMMIGGAVGAVFDARGWNLRALEFGNNFRALCLGISFGDQVQFFRRKPVLEKNMFPDIPLMEDVEFSLRLHRLGRQIILFGNARISVQRWQTNQTNQTFEVLKTSKVSENQTNQTFEVLKTSKVSENQTNQTFEVLKTSKVSENQTNQTFEVLKTSKVSENQTNQTFEVSKTSKVLIRKKSYGTSLLVTYLWQRLWKTPDTKNLYQCYYKNNVLEIKENPSENTPAITY